MISKTCLRIESKIMRESVVLSRRFLFGYNRKSDLQKNKLKVDEAKGDLDTTRILINLISKRCHNDFQEMSVELKWKTIQRIHLRSCHPFSTQNCQSGSQTKKSEGHSWKCERTFFLILYHKTILKSVHLEKEESNRESETQKTL